MRRMKFKTTDCQGHAEVWRMLSVLSLRNLDNFMAEFNRVLKTAENAVLAPFVVHRFLMKGVIMEDCYRKNRRPVIIPLRHNISPFRWKC